ncbi:MAG: Nramp family divalent metal transporter [Luteibacter sp.]|uniref:Nramp family divalent metal transporter n=1 Tax=Rhodanobacteraceae TaxID=1775411 RepID=UPI0005BC0E51|nr:MULTISPECIES: Nramp family divalent metal transporter [Rhodanobacteraceae]MDQ7996711.1 Nramp family divalent metal transporter [Luteibacter sp.]MDQ8049706.1 Nramp family divalent metal transporter [Luteibacter sp.]MDR6643393.1 manganese transport protein [Luteibacter sp. 1214]SDF27904.1 manganese transport protein [Dyella sp. 333MFSha]
MLDQVRQQNPDPAMVDVLSGRRRGLSALLPFAGPAMVVSVAYIDPGNFATNIQAGARYGYALLWVVLLANLVAMLFQSLSARLGIVTGRNLAELCRDRLPRPLVYLMWVVSELAAMATDLAEFLGGAIGLSLLFHMPLLVGMGITGIVTYALLMLEGKGYRRLELTIGALVGVVGLSYLVELFIAPVGWKSLGQQIFVPNIPDSAAIAIAVGIIGATVMPHALFLHSGLTERRAQPKNDSERRRIIRLSNLEVILALAVAGLINLAMVVMAAGAFHGSHPDVAKIETAYQTLVPLLGGAAATIFLVSLVASGFSSSVVGTMAGQMIMQGFVDFRIPIWLRRAITMLPSFAVVLAGVDATRALVLSQVALSIALPFPMIALVWFTSRRDVMGAFRNGMLVVGLAALAALVVLGLNVLLLMDAFGAVSL